MSFAIDFFFFSAADMGGKILKFRFLWLLRIVYKICMYIVWRDTATSWSPGSSTIASDPS